MKTNLLPWLLMGALLWLAGSCRQPVAYQTDPPSMLTQALEQARADGKWVLVDLGAPW
jgi:hypothetical protein